MWEHDLRWALDPTAWCREALNFSPDPWQTTVLRSNAPRQLMNCSRQAGKSVTTALVALHTAIYQRASLVLLLSPSLRQSQELFRKVAGFYGQLRQPVPSEAESALRLELENGSRVISLPASEQTIRGYSGVSLLIIDEASRVEDDTYLATRPFLAVSRGRLLILSTPSGKRGFFHDLWMSGQGWERVKIVAEECPRILPEFLEEERRSLPRAFFAQEYTCEFLEAEGAVFSYEDVEHIFRSKVKPLFGGVQNG